MLSLRKVNVREKFSEINIRQRMYQGKSYITLNLMTEFYPALIDNNIISGAIDAKIDISDISCIDDLVGRSLSGEIGSVTVSVNNNSIWEHKSYDNFSFKVVKRSGRELKIELILEDIELSTTAIMVSLYTTSTSFEDLKSTFSFEDFYELKTEKEIQGKKIIKYFVKEK